MPRKDTDITWQKFHHLTALYRDETNHRYWWFQCDCWNIKRILKGSVMKKEWWKSRVTKWCWCLVHLTWEVRWNWKHGLNHSRFYKIRDSMQQRLKSKTNQKYIKIWQSKWIKCEWKDIIEFKNDMYESYLKHVEEFWERNTTLDRIDPYWNYSKENCRWATYEEQNNHLCWINYANPELAKQKANLPITK